MLFINKIMKKILSVLIVILFSGANSIAQLDLIYDFSGLYSYNNNCCEGYLLVKKKNNFFFDFNINVNCIDNSYGDFSGTGSIKNNKAFYSNDDCKNLNFIFYSDKTIITSNECVFGYGLNQGQCKDEKTYYKIEKDELLSKYNMKSNELKKAYKDYDKINEFKIGRSVSEKQTSLMIQEKIINKLKFEQNLYSKALINLGYKITTSRDSIQ
jgi:hypothetical protein